MNQISYRKVFILGSGFSKSVSSTMPTMKDLSESLLNIKNSKNYDELASFVEEIKQVSGIHDSVCTIENISSIILLKSLYYNNEEKIYYDILKHQLLRWIFDRIESHTPTIDREKEKELLHFFESCSYSTNDKFPVRPSLILTFNYDLLLERLLGDANSGNCSVDYIIRLNRYLSDYEPEPDRRDHRNIGYIKLHGSLNWFTAPGTKRVDLSHVYQVDDRDPSKNLIHYKDIPVYIPMAFSKTQFFEGSLYNVLWNIAHRYLEACEEIVFIGYGFPPSDLDNLYYFLKLKNKVSEIVIREDESTDKILRLMQLFPESKIINMDAFEYIESKYISRK
ncbi:MAG: SIR2 family protein [Bacteroidales bacterium]|nr:SIR2 family protein [Bacteroidales bacterium]